jgi:hypothetical protein
VGPMPPGKGNKKFVVVAVDYFTEWDEAEALASITTQLIVLSSFFGSHSYVDLEYHMPW